MLMVRRDSVAKRDLHVGGIGAAATRALATRLPREHRVLRDHGWAAVGGLAFLGLAAGYVLSRRF
jgi:hypothetical protein